MMTSEKVLLKLEYALRQMPTYERMSLLTKLFGKDYIDVDTFLKEYANDH